MFIKTNLEDFHIHVAGNTSFSTSSKLYGVLGGLSKEGVSVADAVFVPCLQEIFKIVVENEWIRCQRPQRLLSELQLKCQPQ